MTQEQYEKLKHYDRVFHFAVHANCICALTSKELSEIESIGLELGIPKVSNRNCSRCVLTLCQQVGNKYYEYGQREDY